ncbi:MAG: hypothetical protein QXU11_09955 [Thermoproteota archaeon]
MLEKDYSLNCCLNIKLARLVEQRAWETESDEYKLIKAGVTIGVFSKARVEEERILFPLSHGMLLEVSKEGVREIA